MGGSGKTRAAGGGFVGVDPRTCYETPKLKAYVCYEVAKFREVMFGWGDISEVYPESEYPIRVVFSNETIVRSSFVRITSAS